MKRLLFLFIVFVICLHLLGRFRNETRCVGEFIGQENYCYRNFGWTWKIAGRTYIQLNYDNSWYK